jgi:hypothetical protein
MERCRREIAAIEAEIRSGNLDLQGLCLALSDWHVDEERRQAEAQRRDGEGMEAVQPLTE